MDATAIPTRITIDFRDSIHPSRTWILGLGGDAGERVELLARPAAAPRTLGSALPAPVRPRPTALSADCACPDFCERDHANE
ncbi:MAG: hypothetical protein WEC14_07725 [Chloroflexota bacterium]